MKTLLGLAAMGSFLLAALSIVISIYSLIQGDMLLAIAQFLSSGILMASSFVAINIRKDI
jgi:hypothetical protein